MKEMSNMLMMATTIGICTVIIWCQAIKLIKLNKELDYYRNRGHHNGTESKNNLRKTR